jgi:hypothetical protein
MAWNEEKSIVAAVSAIAAGLAAQASRQSRLRSAEKLERELFSASSSVRKIGSHIIDTENVVLEEEQGAMVSPERCGSWAGLRTSSSGLVVAHALFASAFVYACTQTKAGLDIGLWIGMFGEAWGHAVGFFSLFLLFGHVGLWISNASMYLGATGRGKEADESDERKEDESKYRSDISDEELVYFKSILGSRWKKDHNCSESMDPLSDLMSIHGVMRMAINTIKGAELDVVRDESSGVPVFKFDVLSGFLWFKVKEKYPMNWTEVRLFGFIEIDIVSYLKHFHHEFRCVIDAETLGQVGRLVRQHGRTCL